MFKCGFDNIIPGADACMNVALLRTDVFEMQRDSDSRLFCAGCAPQITGIGWHFVGEEEARLEQKFGKRLPGPEIPEAPESNIPLALSDNITDIWVPEDPKLKDGYLEEGTPGLEEFEYVLDTFEHDYMVEVRTLESPEAAKRDTPLRLEAPMLDIVDLIEEYFDFNESFDMFMLIDDHLKNNQLTLEDRKAVNLPKKTKELRENKN